MSNPSTPAPGVRDHAPFSPLTPTWAAPGNVRAIATTRTGGSSTGGYCSLNLGLNSGDDVRQVWANRTALTRYLGLDEQPLWLEQVHGKTVINNAEPMKAGSRPPQADASISSVPGRACAILSADCIPVLLCDRDGEWVGAVHAGWRGLASGVIENACKHIPVPPDRLMAWLGPGISQPAYEVDSGLRQRFINLDEQFADCFQTSPAAKPDKYLADLYEIARKILRRTGLTDVHGGDYCTFGDPDRFFSHRRNASTGRMATIIWLDGSPPTRFGRTGDGKKVLI